MARYHDGPALTVNGQAVENWESIAITDREDYEITDNGDRQYNAQPIPDVVTIVAPSPLNEDFGDVCIAGDAQSVTLLGTRIEWQLP